MEASGSENMPKECRYSNLQLLGRTLGHLSAVYCVLFDSSGRYIFTGADDELVKVWETATGRLLSTLRGASGEITDIAVNYENTLLAAGSVDKIVRVWCLQTAFPVATLVIHNGTVTSVKFCPAVVNGCRYLTSTSTDSTIAFWKYITNDSGTSFEYHKTTPKINLERMRPGCAQISCGSFSPGGMFLAAGSADHNIRVYKMNGPEGPTKVLETEAHSDRIHSIQWAHSQLKFASGSKDCTCLIWYYEQQVWKSIKLLMTTKLPGESNAEVKLRVTMLTWDKSDQWVITASSDNSIKVWNSITGDLIQNLKGHCAGTFVMESHPLDSKILLSADYDGKLFLWNILSGEILASFRNSIESQGFGAIFDAKWSPDGKWIAATDSHGQLLTFGFELPCVVRNVPRELFFHTDYYPLTRDSNYVVLDKQTQTPPHLMPPPFLVDSDGNPYAPYLQKLVPGREHCNIDQLVPKVVLDDEGGRQEVIGSDFTKSNTAEPRKPGPIRNLRICIPRTDDVKDVRQANDNRQPDGDTPGTKRLICEPLDKDSVKAIAKKIESIASIELLEYHKESINLVAPKPLAQLITVAKRTLCWRKTARIEKTGTSQLETQFEKPDQSHQSKDLRSNRSPSPRPLHLKRTWNCVRMQQSNSDEDSEEDGGDKAENGHQMRGQKTDIGISEDSIGSRKLRRNVRVRFNVADNQSRGENKQEVERGVSVSSRGRIRKLTAKARANVSRD